MHWNLFRAVNVKSKIDLLKYCCCTYGWKRFAKLQIRFPYNNFQSQPLSFGLNNIMIDLVFSAVACPIYIGWYQLKSNHILNTIAVFSMGLLKAAESWKWKRWQTTLLWNKCVRNNSKWQMSNESFKWHLRQEVWMSTNKVTKWIWMVILWAIQIFQLVPMTFRSRG